MFDAELVALARRQLDLPANASDSRISQPYLKELRRHLNLCPDDTHFRVTLEPGTGLGHITCLEAGCNNARVPLVRRISVKDGGLQDGLGSLSAYRVHVVEHPTHKTARLERINSSTSESKTPTRPATPVTGLQNPTPISALSGLARARKSFDGVVIRSRPSSRALSRSGSRTTMTASASPGVPHLDLRKPLVKSEPSEAFIPRKRPSLPLPLAQPSSTAFTPTSARRHARDLQEGPPSSQLITPPFKKPKVEASEIIPTPKTPLAARNRNMFTPPPSSPFQHAHGGFSSPVHDGFDDVARTRTLVADIQTKIGAAQADLNRLSRKARPTASEKRRMTKLRNEIEALHMSKEVQAAKLPRSPGKSRLQEVKAESEDVRMEDVKPALGFGAYVPSPRGTGRVKAEDDPFLAPVSSPYGLDVQGRSVVGAVKPEPIPFGLPYMAPRLPVASGSNIKLEYGQARSSSPSYPMEDVKMKAGDESDDARVGRLNAGQEYEGRQDDFNKFLLAAGNAEQFDDNATVDEALKKLDLKDQYTPLPGMTVCLLPHQVIGVAWMLAREKSNDKGGIMADEMGLGKTVQMISVICKNMPTHQDIKRRLRTTLIVAPLALLEQWALEIETKTNLELRCLIYHGQKKAKSLKELQEYDIVLTTYHTLANEWIDWEGDAKAKEKAQKKKKKSDTFIVDDSDSDAVPREKRKKLKKEGLLIEMSWYRVVLDEAQNIRNRRTRASKSVEHLDSRFRWCLTGTPIVNAVADAYGYLRFLRIRPWYEWDHFNSNIARVEKRRPDLASARLQVIFNVVLIRRKKTTMLDGKRLIELPNKDVELVKLQFSEEEKTIYSFVEARSQATFNRYLRAGTVLKNYASVLVMLLRLRQICSHPSLITESSSAFITPEELDETSDPGAAIELQRAKELVGADFVAKMQHRIKESMIRRIQLEKESEDAVAEDEECPICFEQFESPVVTACAHVFCAACIREVLATPRREDGDEVTRYKADERPCPTCRSAVCDKKLFARSAFAPGSGRKKRRKHKASKGKGKQRATSDDEEDAMDLDDEEPVSDDDDDDDDDDISDFIVDDDEDEEEKDARRDLKRLQKGKQRARIVVHDSDSEDDGNNSDAEVIHGRKPKTAMEPGKIKMMPRFLPSTKMKSMMEMIKQCAIDHPDQKTMVVSQWTSCLSLVSDYLKEEGIQHVKYQGDMSIANRDKAIRVFMLNDKACVMLMSLKCGGVGLNLTRANRVISLDLGWSEAVEAQAFDRVHRLGQTREVVVKRLVIENSVEDRILALQERKQNLAEGALGEGKAKRLRLSVKELANLFGMDTHGRVL